MLGRQYGSYPLRYRNEARVLALCIFSLDERRGLAGLQPLGRNTDATGRIDFDRARGPDWYDSNDQQTDAKIAECECCCSSATSMGRCAAARVVGTGDST